jgi:hypothetical protein
MTFAADGTLESNAQLADRKPGVRRAAADQDASEYSDPDLSETSDSDDSLTTQDLIFLHSLQSEQSIPRSTSKILALQSAFHPNLREQAVTRIIQFNYHFQLTSDTLYNAVTYLDIVLSSIPIATTDVEVLATVCFWLSAKVDTRVQPTVEKLNATTGNSYTTETFRQMELQIVSALGFQLSFPTPKMFMRRFLEMSRANSAVIEESNVLAEIALMKFKFVDIRPSMIAAAAVAVSWASLGNMEVARDVVRSSLCHDTRLLADCMKTLVTYGQRIVSTGKSGAIQKLFESVDLKFDINSLL